MIPAGGIIKRDKLDFDTLLRIERGVKIFYSRPAYWDKILVSGGIFLPSEIQSISAAKLMATELIKRGISSKRIILEENSLDTFQNVEFSILKCAEVGINPEITVVTQWQHAIRFWICFRGYKLKIYLKPISYRVPIITWLKEWFFIIYHVYDRRGVRPLALKNRRERRQK